MSVLVLVAAAAVAAIVLRPARPSSGRVVRFGYIPTSNCIPLFVAVEKGLFSKRGLDVQLREFPTGNEMVEALFAGRIDAAASASTIVVCSFESRRPGSFAVFAMNVSTRDSGIDGVLVPVDSPAGTLADLAGKRVATWPGSTFPIVTRMAFKPYLDPSALIIEQMPPAAQLEALATGQVDAAYTMEPFCTMAVKRGVGRVLMRGLMAAHVVNPNPAALEVFSTEFLKRDAEAAALVSAAFDEGIDLVSADELAAREVLPRYMPLDADVAREVVLSKVWRYDEMKSEVIDAYLAAMRAGGEAVGDVDTRSLIWKK
jgi:NitT/TauT family transport system substrate-binding protein